jgi:hypothetical protein
MKKMISIKIDERTATILFEMVEKNNQDTSNREIATKT